MQTTAHAMPAPRRGRVVGLTLAMLLQAGFVYALVNGLNIKEVIRDWGPTTAVFPEKIKPQTPPDNGKIVQPDEPNVQPPQPFVFDDGTPKEGPITLNPARPGTGSGPADHGPVSIAATHTIPPYPPIEQRLGHEGTVMLRLTVSATGQVTDAVVIRSSGYERLDQAARDWVMAHWRYQPAMRGGAAVPSTGNVSVTFNLRNGG